ncbi:S-adenosyl-L-methionine-dependent methyltransferase [Cladochytrium replicatum]|nr:S-adenosyl-L-methionine-dependent methyltransferase [Cladochytrium replicatum]
MKFVVHFAQFHVEFRMPELESLAVLENVELKYDTAGYSDDSPFVVIELPTVEDAKNLVRRSILVKSISEFWCTENTTDDLLSTVRSLTDKHQPYVNSSFKFHVEAYGRTLQTKDQVARINRFSFLPFSGPVDLKNPDVILTLFEDYGIEWLSQKPKAPEPESAKRYFFGVHVAEGNRTIVGDYDVKKRKYLGTTTMDAELSLIMANQALARPGSFVFDPFVGTGSFLFTCSHFGAFTMGSDIDGRQIRGKEFNGGISVNIDQYRLHGRVLDTVVCDMACQTAHHPWRSQTIWDAIVSDPPYGVRAGAKKIGSVEGKISLPPMKVYVDVSQQGKRVTHLYVDRNGEPRYPQTVPYELQNVLLDLLDFAAEHLVPGGRLVYWLPTITEEYTPDDVPIHPRLRLVSNSNQSFGKWSRRLITMEKLVEVRKAIETRERATTVHDSPAQHRFRAAYFNAITKRPETSNFDPSSRPATSNN